MYKHGLSIYLSINNLWHRQVGKGTKVGKVSPTMFRGKFSSPLKKKINQVFKKSWKLTILFLFKNILGGFSLFKQVNLYRPVVTPTACVGLFTIQNIQRLNFYLNYYVIVKTRGF